MICACVPTKYGYSLVCLPPFDDSDWELSTPIALPDDLLIQLRAQILHRLAIYCHDLSGWTNQLPLAIPWAMWSVTAFLLGILRLWEASPKYFILYGWVRAFFFLDGLYLLTRFLFHARGLWRAHQIREKATQGQWAMTKENTILLRGEFDGSEREFIQFMYKLYPRLKPYYDEMLRVEEPWIFSAAPMGVLGIFKFLFIGPKVPSPICIFELGDLK